MKRKITILLLMILALTALFAACSQARTEHELRFDDHETAEFRVTLADFEYDQEKAIGFKDDYTDEAYPGATFAKDMAMTSEYLSTADELMPEAVDGTYVMNLDKANNKWTLNTEQTLYVQYLKTAQLNNGGTLKLTECDAWQDLQKLAVSGDELETQAPSLKEREDCVILKSVIKQSVTFENVADQTPIQSSTESDGFYLGAQRQQVSKYTVATTYDFSGKRPIVKVSVNGADPTEYKLAKNVRPIDPIQILLYLRSYNKTSNDFKDSPAVQMFNPLTGELQIVGFGLNYNMPMAITDETKQNTLKGVSLNVATVSVGGTPYMVEENVPDYITDDNNKPIDTINTVSDVKPKYTTVRFRVGYIAYELKSYPSNIWNNLKYVTQ